MPLRIAIVSQAYHPAVGGVTEHVDGTARALRARGHAVTIVTSRFGNSGDPGESTRDGVRVVRLGRNIVIPYNGAENNLAVGWDLGSRLSELLAPDGTRAFDVVHVHCPVSPFLPLLAIEAAASAGIPVVGTFHTASDGDGMIRLFRAPLRRFVARLARVIAVSEAAREYAARHFPAPMTILPNGVDLERFRPGAARLARYDDGVPNVLFVGRFDPRKGLPELLLACERLAREGRPFRVILVGDGRLRRRAERMASGALRGRVHFEGRVTHDRLPSYYATADVFCSPALGGESFGMVLLEAMALGVPVLATDLPGHRSVVTPGHDGVLVRRRDPDALAAALARLLDDPAERRRLGANGLRSAAGFGWNDIAERLEAIYRSVAPSGARPPREADAPDDALVSAGA
ncbi:MAG TPA: glycosyltransferase family 4 protein [Candidatus Eisenbacteria bacterium]|nr:glycosyltransferase family 4 protein [Candidatus Eisenbacteria bacterium]